MKKILTFILLGLMFYSCSENNMLTTNNSEFSVIIDEGLYANAPSDELKINFLTITNDSLRINFTAGGCSGENWEIKLIDSGAIMEPLPVQRNLRLSLKNEELCEALITKDIVFDISKLQTSDNKIILNITNSDRSILYEY